jgi:hypothetical protein
MRPIPRQMTTLRQMAALEADSHDVLPERLDFGTPIRLPGTAPEPVHAATAVACLMGGTRVLAMRGETPVEDLRPGELMFTMHGRPDRLPLHHVGCARIDLSLADAPAAHAPILIRAGALMRGAPLRDLRVSPGQGIYLEGCLVPARLLVNGVTIIQEIWRSEVSYHYLRLPAHGLLIADGAMVESSMEDDPARHGDNVATLTPSTAKRTAAATARCAPLVLDGPVLERIWRRIAGRAGQ